MTLQKTSCESDKSRNNLDSLFGSDIQQHFHHKDHNGDYVEDNTPRVRVGQCEQTGDIEEHRAAYSNVSFICAFT